MLMISGLLTGGGVIVKLLLISNLLWHAPEGNNIKIDVDGSVRRNGEAGISMIIRDRCGKMLDDFPLKVNTSIPFMCKTLALRKGVQIAKALDLSDVFFEFDNSTLVKVVNDSSCCPGWSCLPILNDVVDAANIITGCTFRWVSQSANLAADCFAKCFDLRMGL